MSGLERLFRSLGLPLTKTPGNSQKYVSTIEVLVWEVVLATWVVVLLWASLTCLR